MDKAIVQRPARQQMGIVGYADYSRAADLGQPDPVPRFGSGRFGPHGRCGGGILLPGVFPGQPILAAAAVLAVAHVFTTTRAAPKMLSLRRLPNQEEILAPVLEAFAKWTIARAIFQTATFLTVLWAALVVT